MFSKKHVPFQEIEEDDLDPNDNVETNYKTQEPEVGIWFQH